MITLLREIERAMLIEVEVSGRCHCGKIEIIAKIDKNSVRARHCTDCQTMSGAPIRAIAVATSSQMTVRGAPKEYIKIADSGNKRIQAFCENCGTQLFATDMNKKKFNIRVGFLEQRKELEPKNHVYTNSSVSWIQTN